MVQLMYFVLLVVSFLYVVVLLSKYKNHISVYYILLAASVVVVNLGFLQMASATTEEAAIMGNLTTCFGRPSASIRRCGYRRPLQNASAAGRQGFVYVRRMCSLSLRAYYWLR